MNDEKAQGVYKRSEKEQKLDRQLRLWGSHGQEKLEGAHLCLLGSHATASETLKNLVLPNIGAFTIVDDAVVTEQDGNSFFVTNDDIGKPRAEAVTANMLQLNPDCQGNAKVSKISDLVDNNIDFFNDFTIVVDGILDQTRRVKLAQHLYDRNIPFLSLSTNGFLGYIRLSLKEQLIVENHADNDRADIYVHPEQLSKWPELNKFVHSFDLEALRADTGKHSHIPYLVIIAQAIESYVTQHGKLPEKYEEKKEFKAHIHRMRQGALEENFDEAVQFAYRAYQYPALDAETQAVFDDPEAQVLTSDSNIFWVCVKAVNEFIANEGNGLLPVSTNVPDMTSNTQDYITLKNIFKAKANEDEQAVYKRVRALLSDLAWETTAIDNVETYVRYFVKHIRWLRVVRTTCLAAEYDAKQINMEGVNDALDDYNENPDQPLNIHWYFAFRAAMQFETLHGRVPGSGEDDTVAADVEELIAIQTALFKELGITHDVNMKCLHEYVRYGGRELHNTAACVGGIAAQIILKCIIQQFVTVNNTILVNGIFSSISVFDL